MESVSSPKAKPRRQPVLPPSLVSSFSFISAIGILLPRFPFLRCAATREEEELVEKEEEDKLFA
jgi:hypothetical protein